MLPWLAMMVAHSEHLLPASLLQHLPLLLLMPLLVLLSVIWMLRLERLEDASPAWRIRCCCVTLE
jgi:hypothetical protein